MMVRIATFNVENLFSRPKAMNQPKLSEGQPYLDDYAKLNALLNHHVYSAQDKHEILELLKKYGLDKPRPKNDFLELIEVRGHLLRHSNGQTDVKAEGCDSWTGWVQLKKEAIHELGIENTARVIAEVDPDILVMVEVENRPTLIHFHEQVLKPMLTERGRPGYEHIMLIDGNDERGIDLGIMSRWPIVEMRSHVDDQTDDGQPVFGRDCPEYRVQLDSGKELVLLPNHFASQGSDFTGKRRHLQAQAVKQIYERLRATHENIVILGDLNMSQDRPDLAPLLQETDLVDAMSAELGIYDGLPGTYDHATAKDKLDYLLLSPSLAQKVQKVDVNRHGFYAPRKWEHFDTITKDNKDNAQASDHHCLYAELEIA